MTAKSTSEGAKPPVAVIYGDADHHKQRALGELLEALLPPDVDRSMALTTYDGTASSESGGPTLASVRDDVMTLPFLAPHRVVVVRDADKFITAVRDSLETLVTQVPKSSTLVLECRSFPRTTKLFKAIQAAGGKLTECATPSGRALIDWTISEARERGKQLQPDAAARLVDLIGADPGLLASEVDKLTLFVGEESQITRAHVAELVGQSREEKIFAVMDAAGAGDLPRALHLWQDVLSTDRDAVYRAVGGLAFVLRKWLAAQQLRAQGLSTQAIAPKVMMFNRARELEQLLRRLPATRICTHLKDLADLDAQAKRGNASIESGVERLLIAVAH